MKIKLTLFALLIFGFSWGQNLTLNDLLKVKSLNVKEIEAFLKSKDWEKIESIDSNTIEFVYHKSADNSENYYLAESILAYSYYKPMPEYNQVLMSINNDEKRIEFEKSIENNGAELYEIRKDGEGKEEKIFKGEKFTYVITINENIKYNSSEGVRCFLAIFGTDYFDFNSKTIAY